MTKVRNFVRLNRLQALSKSPVVSLRRKLHVKVLILHVCFEIHVDSMDLL